MRKQPAILPLVIFLLGALWLAACTSSSLPPSTLAPTVDVLTKGHELFEAKGCATCHGEDAQGSDLGPAIGGHAVDVVIKQVRTPRDRMPAFGPDKISDEELNAIAAYVAAQPSLAKELGIEPAEAEREHLKEALEALEAGDGAKAIQHMQLAAETASGANKQAYEYWGEELREGELSMVEHELEDLLDEHK